MKLLLLAIFFNLLLLFPFESKVSSISEHLTLEEKICRVFKEDCKTAIAVARAESSMRTQIVSRTGDWGLMQINCYAHRFKIPNCEWLLNTENNLKLAKTLYSESGWGIWSAFKNGSYKKFL